ncbi:hypothetical protein BFP76_09685 [Amylibacter kogurei]|uniref:Phospholipid/glycerol acyltransferase domain-containing protein n=1 Tax=Paramylibacter kogurei TaxID=1889778 RepID=A0A2G5K2M0_9RHOB|nr:lysophospholipid acyltransferase family protein [Amylibacter kogurei]PIB23272.1 hypothetical protein BFP76_09685 [Amylibacter kogurei]
MDMRHNIEKEQPYKDVLYDRSELTYANSFPEWYKRLFIKTVEAITARYPLLMRMRRWERRKNKNPDFWVSVMEEMEIDIMVTDDDLARIPKTGSLVVVCNHPHGLVDGLVIAWLLSRVRQDFRIMARALLNGVEAAEKNLLSVSFPHEEDSVRKNLNTRKEALSSVKDGHCIAVFPAGTVSTSQTAFGPVVEAEWGTFTSKLIRQTDTVVLPIYFPGSNSRAFQIANRISHLTRQSLLMYEIKRSLGRPQKPIIGTPIGRDVLDKYKTDGEGLMAYLRDETLALKKNA